MKIDFKEGFRYFKNKFGSIGKFLIIVFFVLLIISFLCLFGYRWSISPISKDVTPIKTSINIGSSSSKIATILKTNGIIKSEIAFKIYVKLNNVSDLKAGNYYLNKSMNIEEIVSKLKTGVFLNQESINITFLEGKTMRWTAKKIAETTNNSEKDVFNLLKNKTYINNLIKSYWFLSSDVKDDAIYYPLEGYLFPETYNFKNKDVKVEEIFKTMLDQTQKVLKPYRNNILSSKYSVHQIFTMASIVEMEGVNNSDRKNIAGVFYNRLKANMPLGSDVTTYYAFKIELSERDLYANELNTYNAYNTRGPNMNGKLPIGPISSISESSLKAAIHPSTTSFLYFVADKHGKVYFTKTFEEHSSKVLELKKSGNWLTY